MNTNNHYLRNIANKLGAEIMINRTNNYYLKKIFEKVGGTTQSHKTNNQYLKYISENISSGDDVATFDWSKLSEDATGTLTMRYFGVYLTEITIPSTITHLGNYCFSNCTGLTSVDLSNVTTLGTSCFSNCTGLTSVDLGEITSIPNSCFNGCSSLTTIIIPNTVTDMGSQSFKNCTSLETIKFTSTTPPTVANSNAWQSIPTTCIIKVPNGTLEDYKTAQNYPNPSNYTYEEY